MKNQLFCTNCKYYKQHYIVADRGVFVPVSVGHCVNHKIRDNVSAKHVRNNEGCELWQPHELAKLRQQYCMELMLQDINKKLNDILAVLRDAE